MPQIEMGEEARSRSVMIQNQMKSQYEHMKFVMGLAEVEKDD
jgi:hypothetical protein